MTEKDKKDETPVDKGPVRLRWKKPNGNIIETNDNPGNVKAAKANDWKLIK